MRVDPTRLRGAPSGAIPPPPSSTGVVPLPPFSTGTDVAEMSGAAIADADVPPPTTLDDSDIRRTLDHVLTVQAAHGQILVDVLDDQNSMFSRFRRSSPPPSF